MGSEEGDKKDVEEIQPSKDGKYPESVSWSQYVGIKESLGKKLDSEKQKVSSLEEKLKGAINQEEFGKVKKELDETKVKLQTTDTELKSTKEKTLSEKRTTLVKKGIPEEKVKELSDKELDAALLVLAHSKPAPDMGGGGGSGSTLVGVPPMELARRAYTK